MRQTVVLIPFLLLSCGEKHRYTCAEMLGTPPRHGFIAILPPGYEAVGAFEFNGTPSPPDFRMWDEHHRRVCDVNGKDVAR